MKELQHSNGFSQQQYTISSLEKVFPRKKPTLKQKEYSVFKNETFHFQVACFGVVLCEHCHVEITSTIKDNITVRKVENVPAGYAENIYKTDDYVINKDPNGLTYPDVLRPLYPKGDSMRQNTWTSFWITVNANDGLPVGVHDITIRVYSEISGYDKTSVFTLTVLDDILPDSDLYHTMWIHYDCICDKHNVEPFTPDFYKVLQQYLSSAVTHGLTMLYTPLFTPAMDTGVGNYRRTVQLVGVTYDGKNYSFDFSRLEKFIDFAFLNGVKYLELSHLATQWGGKHSPQVVATVNGETKRIFGWDSDSLGEEYVAFLNAFLGELKAFVQNKNLQEKIFFHISDEPELDALERFIELKAIITKYFPNARIMDAVCEKQFIDAGVITNPVVATDHYAKVPCKWVYYCCVQTHSYLSNRLLNMPSQRTRIIGMQMYRNEVNGFLHWALNFYHSAGSHIKIDPYYITDACGQFQAGDSFIVYPTENGVYESLRHEVLADAFSDYKALKLLESYIGKGRVMALLEEQGVKEGFTEYNRSAKWHLSFRKKINELIIKAKNNKF